MRALFFLSVTISGLALQPAFACLDEYQMAEYSENLFLDRPACLNGHPGDEAKGAKKISAKDQIEACRRVIQNQDEIIAKGGACPIKSSEDAPEN